jgi:hypothetical protein
MCRRFVLHYRSAGGNLVAEVIFLDSNDKIARYFAHYAQSWWPRLRSGCPMVLVGASR